MSAQCIITSNSREKTVLLWPGETELHDLTKFFENDGVLTIMFEDVEFTARASDLSDILSKPNASSETL